jgi:hypothetical protein
MDTWDELARRTGYGFGSSWTGSASASLTETGDPVKTVTVPGSATMQSKDGLILLLKLSYVPPISID